MHSAQSCLDNLGGAVWAGEVGYPNLTATEISFGMENGVFFCALTMPPIVKFLPVVKFLE
jgi:hypothetical protein